MIQENSEIRWNTKVGTDCFKMGLDCSKDFSDAMPGQFVTIHTMNHLDPLLRRPFSIHQLIMENSSFKGIEILYKVVGKYTEKFSSMKPGDHINLLGPLGNSFRVPGNMKRIFMVAGGIGVAPMVFLATHLKEKWTNPLSLQMFLGGRSKHDLLCQDDFLNLGINIEISTDDGSAGQKGLVTRLLEDAVSANPPDLICACGPMPMLKAVVDIAKTNNIDCQISIETIMACGMGACLGCAVEGKDTSDHYRHVCIDGPVFDGGQIDLG